MSERIERFIAMAFDDWKKDQADPASHPGEEEIACFLEGKLSKKDADRVKEHLVSCDACVQLLAADLHVYPAQEVDIPADVLERARAMVADTPAMTALEIALRVRDFGFEIVKATGDVLFGQEFIPAAILRSRHITDFKDEVAAVKDFPGARIEFRIQAGSGEGFHLVVLVKDKKTQKPLQDLRVTLFRDDIELESRITENGKAVFEHVAAGRYSIDVTGLKQAVARIVIDVRP
ncbi:MAG: zf-HC2 domain-containing protein [Candidatus Omnitrophota bacterium]